MIVRKQWNSAKARKVFNQWLENGTISIDCDKDYVNIRNELLLIFQTVETKAKETKTKYEYMTDLLFGIELYKYFAINKNGFTLETAEDSSFWSYLSIKVIPDIVLRRWKKFEGNEGRFFSERTRIWLGQIWWYIHLTYNENIENTLLLLSSEAFSTDTIMHLVDRTGAKGVFIEVYREIIKQYSEYDKNSLIGKKISYAQLFKNVMKLNTAKILIFEPPLYEGGVKGYVSDLFIEAARRR